MRLMKISSGVLFIKKGKILLAHATRQPHWDIPKGQPEKDESYEDAAIRECREEIGFNIEDEQDLHPLGVFNYSNTKDLVLYLYTGTDFPDENKCKCNASYYCPTKKTDVDEMDDFKYVSLTEVDQYCTSNMAKVIKEILEKFNYV